MGDEKVSARLWAVLTIAVAILTCMGTVIGGILSGPIVEKVLKGNELAQLTTPSPVVAVSETPAISSEKGINLVKNSGFEEPLAGSGWEWGSYQIRVEKGYKGNSVCSVQNDIEDGGLWIGIAQNVPVIPGQNYRYTAWLKWENAAQVHLQIWWLDRSGQKLGESFPACCYDGDSNGWVQKGSNVTAPSDAVMARLIVFHGVLNNSTKVPESTVYIDEVNFSSVQ